MRLIDELDGQIIRVWKFWSVRWSAVAGAFSLTVATYEGFKATDPALVAYIPAWSMAALALGAVACTLASALARGMFQPKNAPTSDKEDHP
jgi:hypothetical protein